MVPSWKVVALPPILISNTFEVSYSVCALLSPTQTLCLTLTLRVTGSIECLGKYLHPGNC
jgi:hypothetical protein